MLFLALRPTVTFPSAVYHTTDGLGLSPSSKALVGPPSHTPITEFVVPKSIPNPTCFPLAIGTKRPRSLGHDLLNAAQTPKRNFQVRIFAVQSKESFDDLRLTLSR